jgi:eukaryotic-like serine/threonine-protein kinase
MTETTGNPADENLDRFGRKRNPKRIAVLVVLSVVVAGGALADYFYHPLKIKPGAAVVVGDFRNSTNDPLFDAGLREVLAAELGQTPFLHVVSDENIGQALRQLGQSPTAILTPQLTRQACNQLGAAEAVNSSIELSDEGYEMLFEMVECKSGKIVERQDMTSEDKDHIIDAVAKAASELREKLGESRESLKLHDASAEQLTSQSLVALNEYGLGRRAEVFAGDPAAAEARYQKAVALDSRFSLAQAGLARVQAANTPTVAKSDSR